MSSFGFNDVQEFFDRTNKLYFFCYSELDKAVIMCRQNMFAYDLKIYRGTMTTKCSFKNYPMLTNGSHAGLLPNNTPIICGGSNTNRCFKYEVMPLIDDYNWTETNAMNNKRIHFSGMTGSPYKNSSHLYYVLGGTHEAEVLTPTGWENIGPLLPFPFYKSCLMVINDTSILVLNGQLPSYGDNLSDKTFIFNSMYNRWVSGPQLLWPRSGAVCGLIRKSEANDTKVFIVVGGHRGQGSAPVDFLNDVSDQWRSGEEK